MCTDHPIVVIGLLLHWVWMRERTTVIVVIVSHGDGGDRPSRRRRCCYCSYVPYKQQTEEM